MPSAILRFVLILGMFATAVPVAADAERSGSATANSTQSDARIPYKSTGESDGFGVIARVIGGFAVVALLALAAVYGLKRFFPSFYAHSASGSRRIQVLEIRRLTPKATLFLVELDGMRLLLGQSGDRIAKLHSLPAGSADSHETPTGS